MIILFKSICPIVKNTLTSFAMVTGCYDMNEFNDNDPELTTIPTGALGSMKPEDIQLNSINGSFEFEKISREIDTIGDLDTCKAMLKAYVVFLHQTARNYCLHC